MRFITPLRYPGGKSKLSGYIAEVMKENDIEGGHYVEPFAGGAGIALRLLYDGTAEKITINDKDPVIFAFWHSILNENERFCEAIENVPVNVDEWKKQHSIMLNRYESTFNRGFATFFMNRTNRSGIIDGGPIGGHDQAGSWKIDARFNKKDLIRRIEMIGERSDDIRLYNKDAALFLMQNLAKYQDEKLIAYMDPPYFHQGPALYMNHYKREDHKLLADTIINKVKCHWIVSYDNVDDICKMYELQRPRRFSLTYTAATPRKGSEIIFFSDELIIPDRDVIVTKMGRSSVLMESQQALDAYSLSE
jgi:DNA adenine methylase